MTVNIETKVAPIVAFNKALPDPTDRPLNLISLFSLWLAVPGGMLHPDDDDSTSAPW